MENTLQTDNKPNNQPASQPFSQLDSQSTEQYLFQLPKSQTEKKNQAFFSLCVFYVTIPLASKLCLFMSNLKANVPRNAQVER